MKKSIFAILLSATSLAFFACSNDDESMSTVEIRLTDAPADYQEVNIDIQGIEINSQDDGGWMALDINEGVYNILELTNGLDTLLGTIQLPAGKISQIRLKLGSNNSIKIADQFVALKTPSGQQSGLKLLLNTTLEAGVTYKILLDFDAARSIVSAGASGKYILKPVIRTITEATSGAIRGQVIPVESTPAVFAISGVDTVGTAFADLVTGKFLIQGLPAGSYTISISPKTGFQTVNKDGVAVSIGAVTDLGLIEILP